MRLTKQEIYNFIQKHNLAVLSTVSSLQAPEAALVGIAVTDELELIFDTLGSSRKCCNLRANPRIAFVIGWANEITMQYEGVADEPVGDELEFYKDVYFKKMPEGRRREKLPDIVYFRVKPKWIRYSDFNKPGRQTIESTL